MLETTFYILGIITMSLWLAIAILTVILVIKVRNYIEETKNNLPRKILSHLSDHISQILGLILVFIGKSLGRKLKNKFK